MLIEAMSETTRRELTISSARRASDLVEISGTDTGPGIAPAIADQLFRHFVITKPQGMGVCLSISRTIVEAHGGHLLCEPNRDGGTIFRLTLRIVRADEVATGGWSCQRNKYRLRLRCINAAWQGRSHNCCPRASQLASSRTQ